MIGKVLKLNKQHLENPRYMALLHDIGKIGIQDSILNKEGKLTDQEFNTMKQHTLIGAKILSEMKSLKQISEVAKYHHERYDGKGYCGNLKGKQIPLEARIVAIADTYDAMTNDRTYRKKLTHEIAVAEIIRCSGTQFDPDIVECFEKIVHKLKFDI